MKVKRSLHRVGLALTLLVAFLLQVTWALAGTTGGLSGVVSDEGGKPVADAVVKVTSASQIATTTTNAGGHYAFLALAPDTYTVTIDKEQFEPLSVAGISIFADQSITESFTMHKALKEIARVTSTAAGALVKSGIGADVYSVNAAQASAAAALSGGGNLNNAYSAMASVPGVQTSVGGTGWNNNAAYIRGQNSYYTGFEFDGIPVNRAFDNYNSSTESSLGLQELQVYTGGGPASITTSGTAGFINQVIKTGTFPGYATATLGVGTPTFYHQAQVEIGGSTPDRNFSYYVGLSGYNQAYRFFDNDNGASLMEPGGMYSGPTLGFGIGYGNSPTATGQGVKPICPLVGQTGTIPPQGCWNQYNGLFGNNSLISDRESVINLHFGIPRKNGMRDDVQALWSASALNNYGYISPDDAGPGNAQFIQSLYGAAYAPPVCSPTMIAPGLTTTACSPSSSTTNYLAYADGVTYNLPFGSTISSSPASVTAPSVYYAPDTPQHLFNGAYPLANQLINVNQNDTGIVKLQYTHELSQAAFIRLYGYSFYSDWLENASFNGSTDQRLYGFNGAAQYQLITHTRGASLDFEDQLSDKNLLGFSGNYTTAGVMRLNNDSALAGVQDQPIGYMSGSGANRTCYDSGTGVPNPSGGFFIAPGAAQPCITAPSYYDVATGQTLAPSWISDAKSGPSGYGAAASTGAVWANLWNGPITGSFNTVQPKFTNFSLSDQWRPNDKLLVNAALRYDNFTYNLPDSAQAADQFYANQTANYTCVLAATNQVLTQPLAPGQPPPASAQYVNGDCNAAVASLFPTSTQLTGWVHPNGTVQDGVKAPTFTAASPSSYGLDYWEPRVSLTFTQSSDTVWRASAGRYTQPPISASVQYLSASGDDTGVWNNTMNLGFYSPFHPIPGVSSAQYDISFEHHIKGTDMSFKVTPFYTWISNWQQQTFIGAGFVTQVPVGVGRNYGLEAAFTKGNFERNGLSGTVAMTFTNSKIMFQNVGIQGGTITNQTTALNQAIQQYNELAKGGSANFACFTPATPANKTTGTAALPGVGIGSPGVAGACTGTDIANPYFNSPAQGLLNPSGWYNPYSTAIAPNLNGPVSTYTSPFVGSLILSYRHDKWAITPSFAVASGGYYGGPLDTEGVDPRACASNQLGTGVEAATSKYANNCDYTTMVAAGFGQFSYLYVPDPQTGTFTSLGQYEQPWVFTGNLQITYAVSPRVELTLTGTNILHTCFGGSKEPWTTANPPGTNVCGYDAAGSSLNSSVYPSNFYNGAGINDPVNGAKTPTAFQQSYIPSTLNSGAIGGTAIVPFSLYFNASVKI